MMTKVPVRYLFDDSVYRLN